MFTRAIILTIGLAAAAAGFFSLLQDDWTQHARFGATSSEKQIINKLAESPMHANLWIALSRFRTDYPGHDGALDMAFLIGAQNDADITERLRQAVQSRAFSDPAIRDFVETDLQNIVRLKPEILASHRPLDYDAPSENKEAFRQLVGDAKSGATFSK